MPYAIIAELPLGKREAGEPLFVSPLFPSLERIIISRPAGVKLSLRLGGRGRLSL